MVDVQATAPQARTADTPAAGERPVRRRRPDPLTVVVVLIVATFALYGIGGPLLGHGVFAGTDMLGTLAAYRDAGLITVAPHTMNLGDTVDTAIPNAALFGDALRHGGFAGWNPYIVGGAPLGSTPNFAMLSPISLPLWFLPASLALGYAKLLEIICAVGGCFLYLRRVRVGRAAALLGGLVFASSAFLVVWTNWPQSKTAAVIPVFFWALERLVQQRRPREIVLVALPVTAMLLGGFPSVTVYTLLTGAVYLVVRVLAEYPRQWRRDLMLLAGGGLGVLTGTTLAGFQLLPWAQYMSHALIVGRDVESQGHIPFQLLLTAIAPFTYGTVNQSSPPTWYTLRILIEENAYIGAAALVLALIAVLAARRGRALLPRGVWGTLAVATGGWLVLIYVGGPPLAALQHSSSIFSDNFIGRARSVLGFLVAALAAAGYELLLRRRAERRAAAGSAAAPTGDRLHGLGQPGRFGRRGSLGYAAAVWLVVLTALALAYLRGHGTAARAGHTAFFLGQVAMGLALVAVALVFCAWLWWGPIGTNRFARTSRYVALVAVPLLVGVQALMLVRPYYARTDSKYFYPMTAAQSYLKEQLGHERYFGASGAVFGSVDSYHELRGLQGHAFVDKNFAGLVEMLPGEQFDIPPTYLSTSSQGGQVAVSPVLDVLSVGYYVAPQKDQPYGTPHLDAGSGSTVTIQPEQTLYLSIPTAGPLRGVGVTATKPISKTDPDARLSIEVRDAQGRVVASADRRVWSMAANKPFLVPLAAEDVPATARLTANITLHASQPLTVAARGDAPAVSTVSSADDGLRLVDDEEAAIYQRLTAQPRARWASHVIVQPDSAQALQMLASGQVHADEVLLDASGPAASGAPATVKWLVDGLDQLQLSVDAQGSGYLVIADALQYGWTATIDGQPAALVPADHGLVAVAMPAGQHTVRLSYHGFGGVLGVGLTGGTALLLLAIVVGDVWLRRRRSRRGTGAPGEADLAAQPTPQHSPAIAPRRHR